MEGELPIPYIVPVGDVLNHHARSQGEWRMHPAGDTTLLTKPLMLIAPNGSLCR